MADQIVRERRGHMARLAPKADSAGTPDPTAPTVSRIFAHRPEIFAAVDELKAAWRDHGTLSPRLRELLRLRIAFHNQCRSCMAGRSVSEDLVSEDLVCALERPAEADGLTDAERAALRYADLLATDHLAIDETVYDELRGHFDEGELVELGAICAYNVGFGRMVATWYAVDDLPDEYAAAGTVTPWRRDEVIRDWTGPVQDRHVPAQSRAGRG
jgi:alkylhydroperoxidase family enzyme